MNQFFTQSGYLSVQFLIDWSNIAQSLEWLLSLKSGEAPYVRRLRDARIVGPRPCVFGYSAG